MKRMDTLLFSATAAIALAMKRTAAFSVETMSAQSLANRFPSLTEFSEKQKPVKIVGLLFSAGWCPDCQKDVPKVETVVQAAKANDASNLAIYYVSSDRSAEEMMKSCNHSVFQSIPYENGLERSALKRHFKTCAAVERQEVGVEDRQFGVPTLILLDQASGRVLTTDGVSDCVRHVDTPEKAMDKWKALLET
jgi:thiol-disulfide isomerase/thioredoxin